MPGPLVPIAVGVVTGAINAIGAADARAERAEAIRRYMQRLEDLKYTSFEKEERLDNISDYYNTNILDEQNSAAIGIGLGGYVNPEVLKLALNAQMLGQRSKALVDESGRIDDYNKGIGVQQAGAELGIPTGSAVMDFAAGAAEGIGLGLQVENALKTFELMDKQMEYLDSNLTKENPSVNEGIDITTQQEILALGKFHGADIPELVPTELQSNIDIGNVIGDISIPEIPEIKTGGLNRTVYDMTDMTKMMKKFQTGLKPIQFNF
jgi:hypothetical protein